jgi:histidyl-tRNA synthetase
MASEKITSVRGMNDLLPPESSKWLFFEQQCRQVFDTYGYREVRTPIVESTALFCRGIGDTTDVVEKEMYTFADRKGRSLTLRPEMTASSVRAYIEHSVHKREPVTRWFYIGPGFRYERVQAGRYRQFYQVGVEVFGIAEPGMDIELISMVHTMYAALDVPGLEVLVNSVGGAADRPAYRAALVGFLGPHRGALCADCQRRLDRNPLRVLDCKVETCRSLVQDAPSVLDHLGEVSRAHFDAVTSGLSALGIPHRVEPRLVRGLDYYTGTVFEVLSTAEQLGAQSTICAGGRYDDLVASLGGPATPAIGFAIGIERSVLSIPRPADSFDRGPDVFFVCHGHQARAAARALALDLRSRGLRVEVEHRAVGMKAQFKRANKLHARFAAIIGETELALGTVKLRDMQRSDERDVLAADLAQEVLAGC